MAKKTTKTSKAKAKTKKAPRSKPAAKTASGDKTVRAGSKLEIVVDLLTRASGCTTSDILSATGWPSVSVPQMAKSANLSLRKEKVKGEPTRYFAEG